MNWNNDNDSPSNRVNPGIGASPLHFDRNIRVALWCHSSGEIIAATEPCLSVVEAERIHESLDEFFEIAVYESRAAIRCVPNDSIVAMSDCILSAEEAEWIEDSPEDFFKLFLCPADRLNLSTDDMRELQLSCE
ncbi:MAG: hypothetical protein WKF77_23965 [Planctomycetaceae bacterium]